MGKLEELLVLTQAFSEVMENDRNPAFPKLVVLK